MNVKRDYTVIAADVKLAQEGDGPAMDRILTDVQDAVYYTCLRVLRSEEAACDVTQEILITVYRKIGTLRDPGTYVAWVNRITANRCKSHLSRPNHEVFLQSDEDGTDPFAMFEQADEQSVPDKALDNAETQRMILEIIDALPDEQRMCVMLYYFDEMKTREIADALDVSEGTVKSCLNYARKSIKEGVERYERMGFKLYGFSPIPFLGYYLGKLAKESLSPVTAQAVRMTVSSAAAAGTASSTAAAGTAAAAATGAAHGVGKAVAAIGVRILTGILTVSMVAGVGFGAYYLFRKGRPDQPAPSPMPTPIEYPENLSDAQVLQQYRDLRDIRAKAALLNDYETFRSCYPEGEQNLEDRFREPYPENRYFKEDSFVAARAGNEFWIVDVGQFESRMGCETTTYEFFKTDYVSYENGRLYFTNDPGEELLRQQENAINAFFETICPGYTEERSKAIDSMDMNGWNYAFLNRRLQFTFHGGLDLKCWILNIWQTENGDVKVSFWLANGTDETVVDYQIPIYAQDDNVLFFDELFRETEPIPPHGTTTVVFTVPADRVYKTAKESFSNGTLQFGLEEIIKTEPDAAASPSPELPPEEQLLELFRDLSDRWLDALKNKDYEAFRSLYYHTDERWILSDYCCDPAQFETYPLREASVAGSKDGYCWLVTSYGNEAEDAVVHGNALVHYENGSLRFAYGDLSDDPAFPDSLNREVLLGFYDRIAPGFLQGANDLTAKFQGNAEIYLNSWKATRDTADASLIAVMQLENGDVRALVSYRNGTDADVAAKQTTITVADYRRNVKIRETVGEAVPIPAHCTVYRVFTIPADRIGDSDEDRYVNWEMALADTAIDLSDDPADLAAAALGAGSAEHKGLTVSYAQTDEHTVDIHIVNGGKYHVYMKYFSSRKYGYVVRIIGEDVSGRKQTVEVRCADKFPLYAGTGKLDCTAVFEELSGKIVGIRIENVGFRMAGNEMNSEWYPFEVRSEH